MDPSPFTDGVESATMVRAPPFVKGSIKGHKNDYNDAEGICEAVGRPTMRFVPVKTVEPQDVQAWHRIRQAAVKGRTASELTE